MEKYEEQCAETRRLVALRNNKLTAEEWQLLQEQIDASCRRALGLALCELGLLDE